eukprot:tig00020816_g14161.t1
MRSAEKLVEVETVPARARSYDDHVDGPRRARRPRSPLAIAPALSSRERRQVFRELVPCPVEVPAHTESVKVREKIAVVDRPVEQRIEVQVPIEVPAPYEVRVPFREEVNIIREIEKPVPFEVPRDVRLPYEVVNRVVEQIVETREVPVEKVVFQLQNVVTEKIVEKPVPVEASERSRYATLGFRSPVPPAQL